MSSVQLRVEMNVTLKQVWCTPPEEVEENQLTQILVMTATRTTAGVLDRMLQKEC